MTSALYRLSDHFFVHSNVCLNKLLISNFFWSIGRFYRLKHKFATTFKLNNRFPNLGLNLTGRICASNIPTYNDLTIEKPDGSFIASAIIVIFLITLLLNDI